MNLRVSGLATWLFSCQLAFLPAGSWAGEPNYLYPDMFPYVQADAASSLRTLQDWRLDGSTLQFSTMFANQGDGLFEIRRGPTVNAERYELIQRVYINNDFGNEYEDFSIGTAPIPGTPGTPRPSDTSVIWFEDFTKFSLHEALVVEGALAVGDEVAQTVKTSWRLSANRGPLPEFPSNVPRYGSSSQAIEQRISVGWADMYGAGSLGQFLDISSVPAGPRYWLRQTVDPANRITETDETNNSFEILIDLNSPGEAFMTGSGDQFLQPGDPPPPAPLIPGDLNEDGFIDIDDWLAFKAGATVDLNGLDPADAYLLGDLNQDGLHSILDVMLFRQFYDQAYGAGAFAAIGSVPEPSTLSCCGVLGAVLWMGSRRCRRRVFHALVVGVIVTTCPVWSCPQQAAANTAMFPENGDVGLATTEKPPRFSTPQRTCPSVESGRPLECGNQLPHSSAMAGEIVTKTTRELPHANFFRENPSDPVAVPRAFESSQGPGKTAILPLHRPLTIRSGLPGRLPQPLV